MKCHACEVTATHWGRSATSDCDYPLCTEHAVSVVQAYPDRWTAWAMNIIEEVPV